MRDASARVIEFGCRETDAPQDEFWGQRPHYVTYHVIFSETPAPYKKGNEMSEASSTEGKVAIAREFVARVFNDHQPELAMEYFTPQMTWHGGSLGTISGAENVTGLLRSFIGALPDLNAVEQDLVASDDLVVMRLVVSATQQGDLLGIAATGKPVRWDAVDIYRVEDDGKISEEWAADDMAAFASQLGAVQLPWVN
jgi:predicted ester cyclase